MPAFFVVCSRSFLNECVISIAFLTLFIRYNRMAIPARVRNARKPPQVFRHADPIAIGFISASLRCTIVRSHLITSV